LYDFTAIERLFISAYTYSKTNFSATVYHISNAIYHINDSKASEVIDAFSRQLFFSSHLLINNSLFNQIFLATILNVSSLTNAILYRVISASDISGKVKNNFFAIIDHKIESQTNSNLSL
jgi:hypothetical protein